MTSPDPDPSGAGAAAPIGVTHRPAAAALAVAAVSLLPVLGLFTTSRIFYVRDLSFFFWPRHLWLRHAIFSGLAPWWDPYVASGQSAIADALNQLVMPITLAVRLLPSDVVSFNLWVALPLPVAALGMFVFLRRHFAADGALVHGRAAAVFGASVFALSGPIVSMLNTPNLAWSVALMPWVLAAAAAPREQSGADTALALGYALQALCGEPVTWAATGAVAAALILQRRRPLRLAGLVLGGLIAAAQLLPTGLASLRAHRGALATPDFWSLHPLSLWETLAPSLFGNYYDAFLADLPWMGALNFGRDPFFYSIYLGPLVLLLAGAGAMRPSRSWIWIAMAVIFTLAALGGYTPVYPFLRRLAPPLLFFRFPVKYFVFAVFAVTVLAAEGWAGGARQRLPLWIPAAAGAVLVLLTVALLAMPGRLTAATHALAVATHLRNPAAGAAFLARAAPPLALRAGGMILAGALLAALSRRRHYAWHLLAAVACADLLATNAGLNLTTGAAKMSPPAWFTGAAGVSRVYIGGRVRGFMNGADADAVSTWQIPAERTAVEGRMELNAELPLAPSGWGVREALSYDLPYLWPAEYEAAVKRFERASPQERDAFLRRTAVRWCVVPAAQPRGWRAIADVPNWNMRVYECHPGASRAVLAAVVQAAAGRGDEWGRQALFDPALPDEVARVDAVPAAAGVAGEPVSAGVRIVEDRPTEVRIEASLPSDGLLVLRDTFDPSWRAEVDGRPAATARANGLQRAVALPPGRHVIRFSYRPREFELGLTVSMAGMLLTGLYWWRINAVSR